MLIEWPFKANCDPVRAWRDKPYEIRMARIAFWTCRNLEKLA